MHCLYLLVVVLLHLHTSAQERKYSVANAHAHNDYEQSAPFWQAWKKGFGSIEADVFLVNGRLIIAHDNPQIARGWTLDSLYLAPLQRCITQNSGDVYSDSTRTLQLMIDVKSEAASTMRALVATLNNYPELIQAASLRIVISGNRPAPSQWSDLPEWIRFDGRLSNDYTPEALKRIEMISDNFARYSKWDGNGELPDSDRVDLEKLVQKVHGLGKKIRFWNAPDKQNSWRCFLELGIDFINTDDIEGIAAFFSGLPDSNYSQ